MGQELEKGRELGGRLAVTRTMAAGTGEQRGDKSEVARFSLLFHKKGDYIQTAQLIPVHLNGPYPLQLRGKAVASAGLTPSTVPKRCQVSVISRRQRGANEPRRLAGATPSCRGTAQLTSYWCPGQPSLEISPSDQEMSSLLPQCQGPKRAQLPSGLPVATPTVSLGILILRGPRREVGLREAGSSGCRCSPYPCSFLPKPPAPDSQWE